MHQSGIHRPPSKSGRDFQNFVGPGPVRDSEIFLGPGPVRYQVLKFFSVQVWFGPRFSKLFWSGPIPGFEIDLGLGPVWSEIFKNFPVLVRSRPRTKPLGPVPTGFGPKRLVRGSLASI